MTSQALPEQSPATRKMSTGQVIESMLIDEISTGILEPGTRLDEAGLAKKFGVSRTPVREALNRLLVQGVLVQSGKRGLAIAKYSKEELAQIFEAMHEIEAVCARIVSQRLTLLSRAEIEAADERCQEAAKKGDLAGYLRANEEFHLAIYKATGNPFIEEIASEFRRRTGPFRAKRFATKADLLASAKAHESLLQSIFSNDSQVASEGMRAHMTESFVKVLGSS